MNLGDILNQEHFVTKLSVPDRWAAIDALVGTLVRLGKIRAEDRDEVCKAVKDRESNNGTGIGFGVALPHAGVPCVTEAVAVVARLQPPVEFQALDNQPVNLCILLLTPQGQSQKHLQILSALARFLSSKERRDRLDAAQTAEEMFAVFRAA